MEATVAKPQLSDSQQRWICVLKEHDDGALVGVEQLIAHYGREALGLTKDELHAARVRFVRHILGRLIFEGREDVVPVEVSYYIAKGVVRTEEVSVRTEHQLALARIADFVLWDDPPPHEVRDIARLDRAIANS